MGCENFLTPSVDQEIPIDNAINSADDLQSFVNGIHDRFQTTTLYGRNFPVGLEVMSDNAWSNGNSGRFLTEARIDFNPNSGPGGGWWNNFYSIIANANVVINSELASSPAVDQAKGQAYALRAFAHMNLLMLFGQQFVSGGDMSLGVPYVTSYGEGGDSFYPARDGVNAVWDNINSDFNTAIGLMDPSVDETVFIDYWGTRALQTRSYLYQEDYSSVISIAEDVMANSGHGIAGSGDYVAEWDGDSGPGSMFEIDFISTDASQFDNMARILLNTTYGDVEVTEGLYNAYADGDIRLDLYSAVDEDPEDNRPLNYRIVGKYDDDIGGTDNIIVIRFAEVVLNYAEALAASGNEAAALIELTKITSERNAPLYTSGSLENVWNERRLELAMEGHRFIDLVRTNRAIEVVDPGQTIADGGVPAGSYRFALPISNAEMNANSSMTQNTGYGD